MLVQLFFASVSNAGCIEYIYQLVVRFIVLLFVSGEIV